MNQPRSVLTIADLAKLKAGPNLRERLARSRIQLSDAELADLAMTAVADGQRVVELELELERVRAIVRAFIEAHPDTVPLQTPLRSIPCTDALCTLLAAAPSRAREIALKQTGRRIDHMLRRAAA